MADTVACIQGVWRRSGVAMGRHLESSRVLSRRWNGCSSPKWCEGESHVRMRSEALLDTSVMCETLLEMYSRRLNIWVWQMGKRSS